LRQQTPGEEIANSVIHGIGAILSVVMLVVLVISAKNSGDASRITSLSIYASTMILLYLASTLYHGISDPKTKKIFKVLDHSAIYLLIAGTYTPVVLVTLRGAWGWALFGTIWGLALVGIIFKSLAIKKLKVISLLTYILMGWLVVIAINPLLQNAPRGLIYWLLAGGLSYTLGTIFYCWEKLPFHHSIWHLFVLGGSASHFFGLLFYIASTTV